MAFPTSPTNGQFYNGYIYNSTKSAWTRQNEEWRVIGTSGNPSLQSGWTAANSQVRLRFRKTFDGMIEIFGGAVCSSATGALIFNLPVGYRPATSMFVIATCYTGTSHVMREVGISSNGDVAVGQYTGISDVKFYVRYNEGINVSS